MHRFFFLSYLLLTIGSHISIVVSSQKEEYYYEDEYFYDDGVIPDEGIKYQAMPETTTTTTISTTSTTTISTTTSTTTRQTTKTTSTTTSTPTTQYTSTTKVYTKKAIIPTSMYSHVVIPDEDDSNKNLNSDTIRIIKVSSKGKVFFAKLYND